MNTQEWSLIIFTILTQMSVGAFLVLGIVHFYVKHKAGELEADRMVDRVLLAIGVTLGLGFLASFLHLGNPLNAPRAVTNFATSWLSREILLGVIFVVLGAVFVALQWFKKASPGVRNSVAWLAALVGAVFVYSQARIYMLDAQPSWNQVTTPIFFFVTTLLLGVLAIGAALVVNYSVIRRKNPECAECQLELLSSVIRWLALASIVLVGIEIIVTPLYVASLGTGSAAAQESLKLMTGSLNWAFILRMVFGFVGAGVLAAFLLSAASSEKKSFGTLAIGAFALVLIAEVLARYLFYASHITLGI